MRGEPIRERLHSGERVYGTHVCSLANPVTAKIQSSVEYDFVFICNEHMPIDRTETAMMCQFYGADISLLSSEMSKRLSAFRKRMGDVYTPGPGAETGESEWR